MRTRILMGCSLAVVAIAAACAGNPQPGDSGYAYNVSGEYAAEFITDDGTVLTGTAQLATAKGGAVSGTVTLTDPFTVRGEVEGLVVGSQLSITFPYEIDETGGSGVATGTAEISEGGASIAGSLEIIDDSGGPAAASFTFERR